MGTTHSAASLGLVDHALYFLHNHIWIDINTDGDFAASLAVAKVILKGSKLDPASVMSKLSEFSTEVCSFLASMIPRTNALSRNPETSISVCGPGISLYWPLCRKRPASGALCYCLSCTHFRPSIMASCAPTTRLISRRTLRRLTSTMHILPSNSGFCSGSMSLPHLTLLRIPRSSQYGTSFGLPSRPSSMSWR